MLLQDPQESFKTVMTHELYAMHHGNHFFSKRWTDVDGPAGYSFSNSFITPASPAIHARGSVNAELVFTLEIFEDCTVVPGSGTPAPVFNNNRSKSDNPSV